MNAAKNTLYIPLYGKAYVSKKGILLDDKKAEEIWKAEGFALRRKSRSKWLAYYMAIRAAVFDSWLRRQLAGQGNAVVVHIGCGLDSRVLRVAAAHHKWYDVDFPSVIQERKRHYTESANYKMIAGDVRLSGWLADIAERSQAVVVIEGVSMYLAPEEMRRLLTDLSAHFEKITLLMDCYTVLAARMSKYKNPVNEVGVTQLYGTDHPESLQHDGFTFVKEHRMIPREYIDRLQGLERWIFKTLYAGSFSRKLYRLFEYAKD